MTEVFLTSASGTSYSKPTDWTDAGHTVELVGCGGDSGPATTGTAARGGGGGSGGAYLKLTYSSGAMGSSTPFKISANNTSTSDANTAATFWEGTTTTNTYQAKSGLAGITNAAIQAGAVGGTGVTNGAPSPIVYTTSTNAGGIGGGITVAASPSGTGGGGAGGPSGVGGAGAGNAGNVGGSGGGGSNGGAAGGTSTFPNGGAGGNGQGGTGGGSAGIETGSSGLPGGNATANTGGGGGGGSISDTAAQNTSGGNGAGAQEYDSTHGGGGGGGGAGRNTINTAGATTNGGTGGNYGGGGGGPGGQRATTGTKNVGVGGGGLICINYTPGAADHTITGAFAGGGSLSAALSLDLRVAGAYAGAGGLTAQLRQNMGVSATFGGLGSLAGNITVTTPAGANHDITASFAGEGSLAADVRVNKRILAAFAGAGALTADIRTDKRIIGAFAGSGALSGTLSLDMPLTASFNGVGALAGAITVVTPSIDHAISATFEGAGSLSALVRHNLMLSGAFSGAGSLTADIRTNKLISASLAGSGALSAQLQQGLSVGASFAGSGVLLADIRTNKLITASFAGSGLLAAQLRQNLVLSAAFAGEGVLTGAVTVDDTVNDWPITASFAGAGSLTAAIRHNLAVVGTFQGSGALAANIRTDKLISATFAGSGLLAAQLRQGIQLTAGFAGSGALSADIRTNKLLSAAFAGSGALTAQLRQGLAISGSFAGAGLLAANVQRGLQVSAAFAGSGALSATLQQGFAVSASFGGVGSLAAMISVSGAVTDWPVAAAFAGAGSLSATVRHGIRITAALIGSGSLSATLKTNMGVSAAFGGRGSLTGALSVVGRSRIFQRLDLVFQPNVFSVQILPVAAAFSGVGALTANITRNVRVTGAFAGRGSLAAELNVTTPAGSTNYFVSANFAGSGALSAALRLNHRVNASFAGAGSLAADIEARALVNYPITARFMGGGSLSAHLTVTRPSTFAEGYESQVGVWHYGKGKTRRTGKRYRIYPPILPDVPPSPIEPPEPPDLDLIYSIGSMTIGLPVVTLSDASGGTDFRSPVCPLRRPFEVGDTVIVEIGGEAGGGLRGTMGVGGQYTYTPDGYYYHALAVPISLRAEILSIDMTGTILTLDMPASTSTTNARIYIDNTDWFNTQLEESHAPGWIVTWPTGKFAISDYVHGPQTGWTLEGAGKTQTLLYTVKGAPSGRGGMQSGGADGATIQDFSIIGNHGLDQFGIPQDGGVFFISSGVWCFGLTNCIVRNIGIHNVFQKAVWFESGAGNEAIDCSMVLDVPLQNYFAQWYFGASDANNCTLTRCTFTCPKLTAGFEGFRSTGINFIDCTSQNGTISFNSTGGWLLDGFHFTSTPNSWVSDTVHSHLNAAIDINSNIQPPSPNMILGGIVRNLTFICQGAVDPVGNYVIGSRINSYNPNITFEDCTFTYPLIDNTGFPGVEIAAGPIYCSSFPPSFPAPDNLICRRLTVTGYGVDWFGMIHVAGDGSQVIDCDAEWIWWNYNIFHNGVYVPDIGAAAWTAAVVANGGTVSPERERLINTLRWELYSWGLWSGSSLDRIWICANETQGGALVDLTTHAIATNSGATFTPDLGFTGNGVGAFINSNFNPTTAPSPRYLQDSACIFGWTNTLTQEAGAFLGQNTANKTSLVIEAADTNCSWRINSATTRTLVNVGHAKGLYTLNRTTAAAVTLDVDGVEIDASPSNPSVAIANENLVALRGQGTFSSGVLACFGFGESLTPAKRVGLFERLENYMLQVGLTTSEPDAEAWAAAVVAHGGTVSTSRRLLVSNMIRALKNAGVWAKLDRLWLFAAENETSALVDLVARALATNVNSVVFVTNEGFIGAGPAGFINSNFSPLTAMSPKFTQNSGALIAWSNTPFDDGGTPDALVGIADNNNIIVPRSSNNTIWGVNMADQTNANSTGNGLFVASRTGASQIDLYRNAVNIGTDTTASVAPAAGNVAFLAGSTAPTLLSEGEVSAGGISSGLTAGEILSLYNHLNYYMTTLNLTPQINFTDAWIIAVIVNGGTVSAPRQTLIRALIDGLIADGVWYKLDRLWVFAAENEPTALTDLRARSLGTNVGAAGFVVDRGYSGVPAVGTTYVGLPYTPSVDGVRWTFLEASIFGWISTFTNAGATIVANQSVGGAITPESGGDTYFYINSFPGAHFPNSGVRTGFFHGIRTEYSTVKGYRDGVLLGTATVYADTLPSATFNCVVGNPDRTPCVGFAGTMSDSDAAALYNRLRTYMTAVGVP